MLAFSSCNKEEVKPKLPAKVEVLGKSGDFLPNATSSVGKAYGGSNVQWIVKYSSPNPITSIEVQIDGKLVSGYPKYLKPNTYEWVDTVRYTLSTSLFGEKMVEFIYDDNSGGSNKAAYKLNFVNFTTIRNIVMFAQDVTPSDTMGRMLGKVVLGSYFSTKTGRVYNQADALAAGNLIDITLAGNDVNNDVNKMLFFVSADRRFVIGAPMLTNPLTTKYVFSFTLSDTRSFERQSVKDFMNYAYDRSYWSNNAIVDKNSEDGTSFYQFEVPSSQTLGLIYVKEVGSLGTTNGKKYARFDIKYFVNN